MSTDAEVIAILEHAVRYVEDNFALSHPLTMDQDVRFQLPSAEFEAVNDALAKHPEFSIESERHFMTSFLQLGPGLQTENILRMATMCGIQAALDWYRRIQTVKVARIRVVGQVYGLEVTSPVNFSNGLSLLPASALTNSPTSRMFGKLGGRSYYAPSPSLIVKEVENVPYDDDYAKAADAYEEVCSEMRRFLSAFSLADELAPIMKETWSEFVETDLQAAQFGAGWHLKGVDGTPPMHSPKLTEVAIDIMERYLALDKNVSAQLDVPMSRLSMAKRRVSPGDKALDGCICLESLLFRGKGGELRRGLSVRVALLLATSMERRTAIAKEVKDFYELRSRTVHGTKNDATSKDQQIAKRGLEICQLVLDAIVRANQDFHPDQWELTGGPPWNRYAEECVCQDGQEG